jgi:hypothetical protein
MNIVEETGRVARSFFDALKDQPLSIALVVMNFVLLGFLFYSGATTASARQETVKLIIAWQERTDTLMANCVSKDVLESVVGALERQLAEMRRQLDGLLRPGLESSINPGHSRRPTRPGPAPGLFFFVRSPRSARS